MSDPYAGPPPARSRTGCALLLLAGFVAGFAVVAAVVLLRAPGSGESPLAARIRPPAGYVALDDAFAGAGSLDAAAAARELGLPEVAGFRAGVRKAWGRRADEPPRAVLVTVVEVDTAARADALRRSYAAAAAGAGGTPFATPAGLRAAAFHLPPDERGRHAQEVAFARGPLLYVVSVVTPARDPDPSEAVRLASLQAAA